MRLLDRLTGARASLPVADDPMVVLAQSWQQTGTEPVLPTFASYASGGYSGDSVVFAVILKRLMLFVGVSTSG